MKKLSCLSTYAKVVGLALSLGAGSQLFAKAYVINESTLMSSSEFAHELQNDLVKEVSKFQNSYLKAQQQVASLQEQLNTDPSKKVHIQKEVLKVKNKIELEKLACEEKEQNSKQLFDEKVSQACKLFEKEHQGSAKEVDFIQRIADNRPDFYVSENADISKEIAVRVDKIHRQEQDSVNSLFAKNDAAPASADSKFEV